jgi:site-specific DNA-methyltransferase (adenine-specific)
MLDIEKIKNTIICGDCLEVMKDIPDKSVNMILTDIPYAEVNRTSNGLRNLDKGDADILTFDLDIFIKECNRICSGSIYIFCGWSQLGKIKSYFMDNSLSTRVIIWEKSNPSPMNGEYIWLSGIEPCVYAKNKNATFNGKCLNSVLKYPIEHNKRYEKHPTEKSIKLFERIIQISSNEKDIIFDPCFGSGTTLLAAKNLKRNFIGIEISEKYCEIARQRLRQQVLL